MKFDPYWVSTRVWIFFSPKRAQENTQTGFYSPTPRYLSGLSGTDKNIRFRYFYLCVYCTKLEPIFKTNDVPRAERVVA